MNMKRNIYILAFAMIIGLTVQSCREMGIDPWDKGNGHEKVDSTSLSIKKLVGTKWQLKSINSTHADGTGWVQLINQKEQFISLSFDSPTHASGTNICNAYGANVATSSKDSIKFNDIFSTDALCAIGLLPDFEYISGLKNSTTYSATEKELRINFLPDEMHAGYQTCTLIFAPLSDNSGNNNGEVDIRIKQMEGQTYTLYSFVNGNSEDILTDSKNCQIQFSPNSFGRGTASILADCNKGSANLLFNADYTSMKLDSISLTKMACQNQLTADRFVDFLRNTAHFEYSDYGTTLTIWSSLTTFGESKMVLKVAPIPVEQTIEIQDTPSTGVPLNTYQSFSLLDTKYDGKYIHLSYMYNGRTDDYQISAFSLFEFDKSMPPTVVVDLVTDGTINSSSVQTTGTALLSLDAIRKRIVTASPSTTKMIIVLRWNGVDLGSIGQMEVQL